MAAFIVNNRVFNPGYEEEFETRFKAHAGEIDKQPRFLAMRILRPLGNQASYVVEIEWESQEAFRAWVGSDDSSAPMLTRCPPKPPGKGAASSSSKW